MRMIFLR